MAALIHLLLESAKQLSYTEHSKSKFAQITDFDSVHFLIKQIGFVF